MKKGIVEIMGWLVGSKPEESHPTPNSIEETEKIKTGVAYLPPKYRCQNIPQQES